MDEQRVERALRQGPPFATRYVPASLALDDQPVVRFPVRVGRLVLIIAVTALLLVGLLVGLAALGAPRDDDRNRLNAEVADLFVLPFEYTLPPGSGLVLTTASRHMYAFTEGSSEAYPGFGYESIPEVRGVTVTFATAPLTHDGSDRARLPLRPEAFLSDLQGNPTLAVGPITRSRLGALPAVEADVQNATGPGYPDIHMGDDVVVALAFPSRLIVAEADGGTVLVHIWAATEDEFAVWLPLATEFVESIRFIREPAAGTLATEGSPTP